MSEPEINTTNAVPDEDSDMEALTGDRIPDDDHFESSDNREIAETESAA